MEDMKNLVITALESKGVLGQIRAKLRSSVFKIVDEQETKQSFGCGLKWENKELYRLQGSKMGNLVSELIREFMEEFRMDYSLSVFIPESGISPERLKKEDIKAKLGLKEDNYDNLPLLYYIVYFFIMNVFQSGESADLAPASVQELELNSEKIIDENLNAAFLQYNDQDVEDNTERINNAEEDKKKFNSKVNNFREEVGRNTGEYQEDVSDIEEDILVDEDVQLEETPEKGHAAASQSMGPDMTVESGDLNTDFNYVEQVEK